MPRNGSGQFVPANSSFNPAINGVLATAGDWQALLNDLSAALTQSVSRDGQSPMLGNLNLANNKITNLAAGTATGDAATWAQLFGASTQADIASAATTDIGVQNTSFLRVTGTTTITSFGSNFRGPRFLTFEGAVTLTHSSTLVLPGNANITTAAGDSLIVIPGATLGTADKWVVMAYQKNAVPIDASTKLNTNNPSYTGTLTGGTGVVNLGSGQFYKDTSGNVGIGTSSPSFATFSSSSSGLEIKSANTYGVLRLGGDTGEFYVGSGLSSAAWVWNQSDSPLIFGTNDTERARIDSSGNFQMNSGYGSVATAYGCRAWVNFNGTGTVAIRASGNVSSLTDLGTGSYQVNFTTAMPDANYSVATSAMGQSSATQFVSNTYRTDSFATTNVKVFVTDLNGPALDSSIVTAAVFR
jgi:hypothetical protein